MCTCTQKQKKKGLDHLYRVHARTWHGLKLICIFPEMTSPRVYMNVGSSYSATSFLVTTNHNFRPCMHAAFNILCQHSPYMLLFL